MTKNCGLIHSLNFDKKITKYTVLLVSVQIEQIFYVPVLDESKHVLPVLRQHTIWQDPVKIIALTNVV